MHYGKQFNNQTPASWFSWKNNDIDGATASCLLFADGRRRLRQSGLLDGIAHMARQVMGGSQVASEKTDIAVEHTFPNDLSFPRAELTLNLQLRRSAHSCHGPPGLAARCVSLHCCFQNEQVWKAVGIAIPTAQHLLELLRLG